MRVRQRASMACCSCLFPDTMGPLLLLVPAAVSGHYY